MAHWKLTLAYDGSAFHGWQVQPELRSVQGTLAEALYRITGETVLPQGSGRTDAGVHALAQVCSFTLQTSLPAVNLERALNRALPPSIRIGAAEPVDAGFHARHSALRKTYEYRIFERRVWGEDQVLQAFSANSGRRSAANIGERLCSPFLAPFVWDVRWPLDPDALQRAALVFCGTHDFRSFAASDPERSSREPGPAKPLGREATADTVRTIFCSAWERRDGLLVYSVTGSGFLHHMVRNLVGTMVNIGRGSGKADDIPLMLAAQDRASAGPTAPARGLFLVDVEYPGQNPGGAAR